jgi:hypothetical protein
VARFPPLKYVYFLIGHASLPLLFPDKKTNTQNVAKKWRHKATKFNERLTHVLVVEVTGLDYELEEVWH